MAETITGRTFDGIHYEDASNVPDLGSFVSHEPYGHMLRNYYGRSTDISKLPTYVQSGSTAYCVDTGDVYMFEESTKTWIKQ